MRLVQADQQHLCILQIAAFYLTFDSLNCTKALLSSKHSWGYAFPQHTTLPISQILRCHFQLLTHVQHRQPSRLWAEHNCSSVHRRPITCCNGYMEFSVATVHSHLPCETCPIGYDADSTLKSLPQPW